MAYFIVHIVTGKRIASPSVPYSLSVDRPECGCGVNGRRVTRDIGIDEMLFEHADTCRVALMALETHGEASDG